MCRLINHGDIINATTGLVCLVYFRARIKVKAPEQHINHVDRVSITEQTNLLKQARPQFFHVVVITTVPSLVPQVSKVMAQSSVDEVVRTTVLCCYAKRYHDLLFRFLHTIQYVQPCFVPSYSCLKRHTRGLKAQVPPFPLPPTVRAEHNL